MIHHNSRSIRILLLSLLLALTLAVAVFAVQALAAGRSAPLATLEQMVAIQGGEQLLLSPSTEHTAYLPWAMR